jgi:Tfp pilus assembly protein PilE
LNQQKQNRARADMQRIADALERYRADKGAYLVSDSHAVLIDHLSPAYIREVIRLDPWRQPYKYVGQRDTFTLVSPGPDGKDGTADDIARSK